MKKLISMTLSMLMVLSLAACKPADNSSSSASQGTSSAPVSSAATERQTVKMAGLKGPSAMGMVKLMEDDANNKSLNDYDFTLAGAPDELVGKIVKGEIDAAALPTNLAATLYKKTEGKLEMVAINSLGVLYVVENGDTVKTVADLKGKTIYSSGKGSTPEFALNYILKQNGLEVGKDVTVEYKTEHTEIAQLLSADKAAIAVLPQPFVTSVLQKNPKARIALDLTAEWDKATNKTSRMAMTAIVVQKKWAEENPQALENLLKEYKASNEYVTDPANIKTASELVGKYEIIAPAIAEKAIPMCNLVFIEGDEMKSVAEGFLQVLFSADPKSVGGAMPDAAFYYKK